MSDSETSPVGAVTWRDLTKFAFCAKGRPSRLATKRYREILDNLAR